MPHDDSDRGDAPPPVDSPPGPSLKLVLPLKVMLPLVLGIVAALAIAVYAELGYRRLETANQQMALALELQATLNESLTLIVDAETGQRGYLLTSNPEYLEPYTSALPRITVVLRALRERMVSGGTASQRDSVGRLTNLFGKKLGEMEAVIALFEKEGATSAMALLNTGFGRRVMNEIRAEVDGMANIQNQRLNDATRQWTRDIEFARLGMQSVTALTVALLLIVWLLTRREVQQREVRRRGTQQEELRLKGLVEARTAELTELSNYLQKVREDEKSKLARDIHDELGGILVGAKMDVAWVESRMKARDPEAAAKLARAMQALDDGVGIKRRIIEELRPTLLDNLGLAAALDWQVREICDRAGLRYDIATPDDDSRIPPTVSIALYRIMQEALTNIVKYARAKSVSVDLGLTRDHVTLAIEDDGVGIPAGAQHNFLSHGITGMRQRVLALHGDFSIARRPGGGTAIGVTVPLAPPAATPEAHAPALAPEPALSDAS